jgi:acetolactate synthase-1/2/3 large subunit
MAKGMGVEGIRTETAEQFNKALETGLSIKGPYLIEAVLS